MDIRGNGKNLTQQLSHDLGMGIVNGDYSPSVRFPSEAKLCEEFQISRSATREAVKMLTAKGLLSSRPRQGIRILPRDQWNMFDPDVLGWILHSTPSFKMLKEFLQLRLAIEPEAAALAAAHHDAKNIQLIHSALERMKAAGQGLDDPLESDISFHLSILSASENPFFMQLRSFVNTALRVSIRYTNRIKGVNIADYHDHKKVYDAIAQGDPDAARRASRVLQEEAIALIAVENELPEQQRAY